MRNVLNYVLSEDFRDTVRHVRKRLYVESKDARHIRIKVYIYITSLYVASAAEIQFHLISLTICPMFSNK